MPYDERMETEVGVTHAGHPYSITHHYDSGSGVLERITGSYGSTDGDIEFEIERAADGAYETSVAGETLRAATPDELVPDIVRKGTAANTFAGPP